MKEWLELKRTKNPRWNILQMSSFCLTYVGFEFDKIIVDKNKNMWLAVFIVGFDLENYK